MPLSATILRRSTHRHLCRNGGLSSACFLFYRRLPCRSGGHSKTRLALLPERRPQQIFFYRPLHRALAILFWGAVTYITPILLLPVEETMSIF